MMGLKQITLVAAIALVATAAACGSNTTSVTGDAGPTDSAMATADGAPGADSGTNPDSGVMNMDSGVMNMDAAVGSACTTYCAAMSSTCTGANQQYSSDAECMNACNLFVPGTAGDTSGDSLACRAYHIGLAATGSAVPHCWHAGPYGAGACGSECDDFCSLALAWCTTAGGFDGGAAPYATLSACKTACAGFATVDAGSAPSGYSAAGPASGNSLQCREYHLGAALGSSAGQQLHCNHIGTTSPVCQ